MSILEWTIVLILSPLALLALAVSVMLLVSLLSSGLIALISIWEIMFPAKR